MKAPAGARPPRDRRIDLFRGVALLFIFLDHIPDNVAAYLTVRNVGLSDAAEIFVFLAGYSASLAYARGWRPGGRLRAVLKVLRRTWTLYIAHIFLFALLTGVVFLANARVETRDFVSEMGLGYFLSDTEQALLAELTLRFKPNLMDPLPLYIVLLAVFALCLPALARMPWAVLAVSGLVYAAANHWTINLDSRPNGVWFFNPLAWQFLFFIGAVAALKRVGPHGLPPRAGRAALALAAGFLAVCAALALSWNWPALHDAVVPQWLGRLIYPIGKTDLDAGRLLHFLALAFCAAATPPHGPWLDWPIMRTFEAMGRHGLEIFCAGVLLAPVADALNALCGDAAAIQLATSLAGFAAMAGFAFFLDWSRRRLA